MNVLTHPLFVATVIICLVILFEVLMIAIYNKGKKAVAYVVGSCLGCYLIALCWLGQVLEYWCVAIIAVGFYLIVCTSFKFLTSFILLGSLSLDRKKLLEVFMLGIPVLIVSPDYALSKMCKDIFWQTNPSGRRKIIQAFNLENLVLSFLFVFFFWFLVEGSVCSELLLAILGYRVVSRTVEIVVSFVMDVCSREHSSTLSYHERIALAFLSILEVVILAFGVGICSGQDDFSQAAIKALLLIGSISPAGGRIGGVDMARIFCGIACFALIGTVIGSYLNEKKVSMKPAKEDVPQLFVMDKQGVRNVISFDETNDAGRYKVKVVNQKNWSFIVNYQGNYFPIDQCKHCDEAKKDGLSNNFVYEGDVFEVTFNTNNDFVEIKKGDKNK